MGQLSSQISLSSKFMFLEEKRPKKTLMELEIFATEEFYKTFVDCIRNFHTSIPLRLQAELKYFGYPTEK